MKSAMPLILALLSFYFVAAPGQAHYNMLVPETAAAKRGDTVAFTYLWGHPFEHQLFDAPSPKSITVNGPDGKKTDLMNALEKTAIPTTDGKNVTGWHFRFKPELRGDYVFYLVTEPIWMEAEREYWQDTVKVTLHVQAQKNWDAALESGFEIVPLTRPYGLQPGMVFQAEVAVRPAPSNSGACSVAGTLVEIERYNPTPPRSLPPDEQITRTVKTDRQGVLTCTHTDAGWWCLTAQRDGGKLAHNGKKYPVRQRTTYWVFVDEKISSETAR